MNDPLVVKKLVNYLPVSKELWEDWLTMQLMSGFVELLPDVKFEDAWQLMLDGKPFVRNLLQEKWAPNEGAQ